MNPDSSNNLQISVKKFTRIMVFIAIGFVALYIFIFLQLKQTESQLTSYGNVTDSAIGNFLENLADTSNVQIERTVEGIALVVKGGEGSSLNADLFDGKDSSYFTDAGNIKSGTLPDTSYSAWNDLTAEGFVSNGKIKSEYLPSFTSSGSEAVSWNDIQNRPAGLDDGDDTSVLSETQVEGYITNGSINLDAGTTLGGNALASQTWVSSQNYLTTINFSQIANGTGIYLDYRPNNIACAQGEVLKYDAGLSRWTCGTDSGAGAASWGGISGNLADQVDLNSAITAKLDAAATFGGDVSGTYGNVAITNDSHDHTGATISSLGVADFTSQNISQWTNDSGFISGLTHAQVTNSAGVYWDYRPNNSACTQDQVLKYDAGLNRWGCAADVGASSTTWGAITGTLADQTDLNSALNSKLGTGATFGGDVSGAYNAITVTDDSHTHTGATVSGLGVADFTSPNISQWTNDSGFISGVNFSQVTNGANIYLNYKPNDVACSQDQTLKYDASLSRWICGNDNGAGTIAWGSITGTLADQSDLSTALSSKLNLTANYGGDVSGTYDNLVVANDSHNHTGATITAVDIAQVVSSSGKYFSYKPNDVACANGQILEYDATNSRWVCADDDTGTGGGGGGGEVIIIANDLAPTGTTLNENINFTTTVTGDYLLYVTSTAYTTAISQKTLVAKIDGNTVGTAGIYMNSTNFHYPLPPVIVKLTNLSAGSHTLNVSITGTHTIDANDRIHAYVMAVGGSSGVAVNVQQANGTTDVNTNSTSFVDMPDMTLTMTTAGNPIEIAFAAGVGSATSGGVGVYRIMLDGVQVGNQAKVRVATASVGANANLIWTTTPSAGSHTIKIQWLAESGVTLYNRAAAGNEHRTLIVKEYLGGSSSGGGTATVGSMTGTSVFADSTADDDWLGLGASAAKIEFDDQTTDEILLLNANVGIGTSTPTSTLSVNGSISIPTQTLGLQAYRMNVGTYGTISETAGGLAYITGNAVAASLTANNQIVKTANDAGQFIRMRYDTGISFHTNITGGTGTSMSDATNSRMFIGLDGKIGINTTTPQYQFHVQTADNALAYIGNGIMTNGHYTGLAIGYSEPGPVYAKSAIVQEQLGDGAARGKIHILNDGTLDNSNATLADARLTVNYDGKIGIGQTSPTHQLDVSGNIGIASSGHLNFGATDGSTGYGIRDNAGTIEYKNNGGEWAPIGSGTGGSGIYTTWDPDAPPVSSTTQDDEFIGAALDPKWTVVDFGSTLTVSQSDKKLNFTDTSHAGTVAGVAQAIPAGDFTIVTRVEPKAIRTNYLFAGLTLYENAADSTKRIYTFHLVTGSGETAIQAHLWNSWNSWNGSIANNTQLYMMASGYLRIRRTGTTYSFDYSEDGSGWIRLHTGALAFTPQHFGLFINNQNTGETLSSSFEFFRYMNSNVGTAGKLYGRLIEVGGGGGGSTTVGSMSGATLFSDTTADDQWLGLGSGAGRIEFDDQATDEIQFLNANVVINGIQPQHTLDVNGNIGIASSGYLNFGSTDGSGGYGLRDNAGVIEVKDSTGTWAAIVEEAPSDGKYYVRKDGAWVQVPTTDPSWSDASMQLFVGGTQVTLSAESKQRYKINNGVVTIVAHLKAAAGVNLTGNFQVRNLPVLPINTSALQLLGTGEWRNENTGYYTTRMMFESATGYLLPKMYNDYAILSSTINGNENDLIQFTVTYETNQGLGFNSPLNVAETDGSPSVNGVGNITVPNGTLTDNGNGQVFLDYGSARTDKLFDQTAGVGGQATFDLSGISGNYYMLKVYISGRHDNASSPNTAIFMHFNNDSTETNYKSGASRAAGTTHTAYTTDDSRVAIVPAVTATRPLAPGQCEITITDPFNTTFEKQVRSSCGMRFGDAAEFWAYYMQWENSAAINRITIVPNLTGNFSQGTRVIVIGYK